MARAVGTRTDFVERVVGLRTALEEHAGPPQDPPRSRALRSLWETHLRSRGASVLRRLSDLARAENWEFGEDDGADSLRAKKWPAALADLAMVHAELSGALDGYSAARVTWQSALAFGVFSGRPASHARKEKRARERAAETKAGAAKAPAKSAPTPAQAAAERANKAIVAYLASARAALANDLRELRALVHDLQKAEEERLVERASRLAAGSADRRGADAAIAEMRRGRIDARNFSGPSASRYGALLRQGWLRPWLRAVARLD